MADGRFENGQSRAGRERHLNIISRLFIKNTGPCEVERHGIWADACPVLVS
jgi:hypothetical protein